MAKLTAPKEAVKCRGERGKWHLRKPADPGLTVCGLIVDGYHIDQAKIADLEANELCCKCLGLCKVTDNKE